MVSPPFQLPYKAKIKRPTNFVDLFSYLLISTTKAPAAQIIKVIIKINANICTPSQKAKIMKLTNKIIEMILNSPKAKLLSTNLGAKIIIVGTKHSNRIRIVIKNIL